jgi:hypothetical protein
LLGQIYAQGGDTAKAIEMVEKGLAIEPDNDFAKRLLQRLKQ